MATTNDQAPHAPTARKRELPGGDEEATTDLRLGEFQGVPSLSLSEARLLITAVKQKRGEAGSRIVESE